MSTNVSPSVTAAVPRRFNSTAIWKSCWKTCGCVPIANDQCGPNLSYRNVLPQTRLLRETIMKRRDFLAAPAFIAGAGVSGSGSTSAQTVSPTAKQQPIAPESQKSSIRQSVMGWCFKPMDALTLAAHAKDIGLVAIEGIPAADYPAIKKLGLGISLVSSHGFQDGPLDPENHAMVESKLRESIDLAKTFGAPNVITFTGMTTPGIPESAAMANCLRCWRNVLPYAESKGIGLVLEHLNSVDDSHPMKGHPGYFGDDLELCVDLVKSMDSPNFRLLFDIYHVQIMHGDLIRNIRRYHEFVGHYHTAGNPGRGELDETQEINYPAVIKSIVATGFTGYLAQEFIPTGEDPVASLRQAFQT